MTANLYDDLADVPPPLATPDRALAIGAHPDDIEFGAGGTLARWAAAGCEVTMLVVTDGSKGTWDPRLPQPTLVARRKQEQLEAARALGAEHVIHLDRVDGELLYSMALRAEMCLQIRIARPDVVLTHDPWQRYQLHPDHRVTGLAVVDGVVAARDHLFFPEQGMPPHRPNALLLWSADSPDHVEDIDGSFDQKVEALLHHASQHETTMGNAGADEAARQEFIDRLDRRARRAASPGGPPRVEAFKRITP